MEPTANALEIGCMGNLNAPVTVARAAPRTAPGRGSATTRSTRRSRRWRRSPISRSRDVEIDGLVFREVVNVTTIEGGGPRNVDPRRVEATVNLRYAPNHTPAEAEARLRELLGPHPVEVEIVGNAPPGPVGVRQPARRRGSASRATSRSGPKQAWTPVAEFAEAGIDAVNFGPGDPRYAHRDDEQVDGGRARAVVRDRAAFLAAAGPAAEDA